MAAYQCLNCHTIESGVEDCCEKPDLFCINDMPDEIQALRRRVAELEVRLGLGPTTLDPPPPGPDSSPDAPPPVAD